MGPASPPAPSRDIASGLSGAEARERLERDGPNDLPTAAPVHWSRQLAAQFSHFFAVMLWGAAGLALLAGTPQLGVAIAVIILVNGIFSFIQERRAEHAAQRLQDLLPRRAVVIRDGTRTTVDASQLVEGDLVALAAGDRISADVEVVDQHALAIDASTMTGESVLDRPDIGEPAAAGTYVVEGDALATVTATGPRTRLAQIALLTRANRRRPSPLAVELHRVVTTIARIALLVGIVFFVISVVLGMAPSAGFVLALGVTVALVPEGLLPTVTLALAVGAQRMAERNALVRHLESVETLGSTTFICTDKTGTLTRNQMEVVSIWTTAGTVDLDGSGYEPIGTISGSAAAVDGARHAAWSGLACSTGRAVEHDGEWIVQGDPMEAAIDAACRRLAGPGGGSNPRPPGLDEPNVVRRFPFDPRRKRTGALTDEEVVVKGAPESVLAQCGGIRAPAELAAMTDRGLRVLAVAARPATDADRTAPTAEVERGLHFVGLIGLEDLAREEVRSSLEACRRAGIKVAMVTGDHPGTALAIGRRTGLVVDDRPVLVEETLPADDDELAAVLDHDGTIVARVDPETKLRIARVLQQRGHVVAMTGDGVNDGPALQQADVGIAMGASGTDVAREASDLVLLDDNFATIVVAVELGRATYANIRRFLTYHLTDNVAELTPFLVFALSAGRIPLALTVIQILCLDIGTDLLPALALGAEPPSEHVLDRPPPRTHLIDRPMLVRVFAVLGPVEAVIAMAAFLATFALAGWRPGTEFPTDSTLLAASGAAFATVVVGQAANAFVCRSDRRPVWAVPLRTNRLLPLAVAIELATLVVVLGVPPIAAVLGQTLPPADAWFVILAVVPALVAVDGAHKWARRHRRHPR